MKTLEFLIFMFWPLNLSSGSLPSLRYSDYQCGCGKDWSRVFYFRALPNHTSWSPRLAIFGDMGVINGKALPELQRETIHLQSFDVIMHVGDFAYNMDTVGVVLWLWPQQSTHDHFYHWAAESCKNVGIVQLHTYCCWICALHHS